MDESTLLLRFEPSDYNKMQRFIAMTPLLRLEVAKLPFLFRFPCKSLLWRRVTPVSGLQRLPVFSLGFSLAVVFASFSRANRN